MDKSYMKFTKSFKLMFVFIITFALYLVSYIAINKAEAKPTEVECLTEAIYFEARGETFVGQLAVANVILERVRDSRFPPTVCEVVHAGRYWEGNPIRNRCAFSYWCDGKPEIMKDKQALKTAQNLVFESYEKCFDHVQENLETLKRFGRKVFENKAIVKQILCIEEEVHA